MANLGSLVLSGGISLGVLTGFLVVLFSSLKWASQLWRSLDKEQVEKQEGLCTQCLRCGEDVIHQTYRGGEVDNCYSCSSPVCSQCCIQDPQGWLCASCLKEREKNLNDKDSIFSVFRGRFQSIVAPNRSPPKYEGAVRDFIEKLTEGFLGGSLDHVRVNRLTGHPSYMGFMEKYEGVLSLTLSRMTTAVQVLLDRSSSERNDDPTLIEVQLKHLIKEIIQEALQLPSFQEYSMKIQNNIEDLSTKTYEDILATAILNKVVENFNFESKDKAIIQSTSLLQRLENEDPEWPLAKGDNEIHDRMRKISAINDSDHLKLTNGFSGLTLHSGNKKAIFPEYGVDILNDCQVEDSHTEKPVSVEYWEENWLFQKNYSHETIPAVPMLVPCPKDDIGPTIGEVNVNNLCELSDCSDSEIEMIVHSGKDYKTSNNEYQHYQDSQPEKHKFLQDSDAPTKLVEARNLEIQRSLPTALINAETKPNEEVKKFYEVNTSPTLPTETLTIQATKEKDEAMDDEVPEKHICETTRQIEQELEGEFEKESIDHPEETPKCQTTEAYSDSHITPNLIELASPENLLEEKGEPLKHCPAGPESLTFERDSEYVEEYASIPQMENKGNERESTSATPLQKSSSFMPLDSELPSIKPSKKGAYSIESELEEYLPSVRLLAKHFSKHEDNFRRTHVHSLTARNTARESKKLTRYCSEETLPTTNIHNNIEFWERMASKHQDIESINNKGLD